MDFDDAVPDRYWVTNPEKHPEYLVCGLCGADIDREHSIPVKKMDATYCVPLCAKCATEDVADIHPVTLTYLDWMAVADMRWWSAWVCNHCLEFADAE